MHYLAILIMSLASPLFSSDDVVDPGILDLDTMNADYIVDTKQIHIPGYPHTFNPSIVRWEDGYLFSFRIRDSILNTTNKMGLIFLDSLMEVASKPYVVRMPSNTQAFFSQEQDPRLIFVNDKLFFVYNNVWQKKKAAEISSCALHEIRRMIIAELCFENDEFYLKEANWLLDFESEHESKTEKNWVPFSYSGELLLSYTIFPHRVFRPIANTNRCQTFAISKAPAQWNWGGLRGGSQAIEIDGRYLSFFHTCKDLITVQSGGKRVVHYFMGAYTFSNRPPFQILSMSPQPIIGPDFYRSPNYKTWKPLKVIFPGGIVADKDYIYVAYGKQDWESWIVKMDKKQLFKSLIIIP